MGDEILADFGPKGLKMNHLCSSLKIDDWILIKLAKKKVIIRYLLFDFVNLYPGRSEWPKMAKNC